MLHQAMMSPINRFETLALGRITCYIAGKLSSGGLGQPLYSLKALILSFKVSSVICYRLYVRELHFNNRVCVYA
jgi:hypothetical protein